LTAALLRRTSGTDQPKAGQEPSTCACIPEGQLYSGLHRLQRCQQVKRGDCGINRDSGHWDDWLRDQGHRWCFPPSHQWQGTAQKGAGKLTWLTGGSRTGAIGQILASLIMGRCTQHRACWRQMECNYLKGEKGFLAMSWQGSLRGL